MNTTVLAQRSEITWASFSSRAPSFTARGRRPTAAQRAGLNFEKEALSYCSAVYRGFFIPRPWLTYMVERESSPRWCQPDGLLFQPRSGVITIVEVKIRHTASAWAKLDGLYRAVVQTLFPAHLWEIATCELTRMFDCAVSCMEKPILHKTIDEVLPGEFGVVTWKP